MSKTILAILGTLAVVMLAIASAAPLRRQAIADAQIQGTSAQRLDIPTGGAQSLPHNLKVAAVQFRSHLNIQDNCRRMIEFLHALSAQGVQVAVFPECALTGYALKTIPASPSEIAKAERRLEKTCRDRKIAAVFGTAYKVNGHAYDAADVVDSRGELIERYGKIYLAGEKWATPGNHIAYFDLDGIPSTVIICHDERYPELVRLPALAGARILYYISSESSLKEPSKMIPYRAQIEARAVENGIFVVASNAPANPDLTGSHGQSRIVGPDGNIIKEASVFGEDVLISTLDLSLSSKTGESARDSFRGPLGWWWRSGMAWMMKNRNRRLN